LSVPATPPNEHRGCRDSASSTDFPEVNNPSAFTSLSNNSLLPPSPPASIKSRRDRTSSQREANRSKQFTTRLQRSASTSTSTDSSGELVAGRRKGRFQTSSLPADHGLKAIEPPHEQALTKMAFAEQQKWITVQQKTFTKWYVFCAGTCMAELAD
jgi:hypothetical protein